MIKYFSTALKITNNNIILATPLILFLLLISLYQNFLGNINTSLTIFVLGLIITILMWSAFLGGWLYIVRQAILINYEKIDKNEKIKKSYSLMNSFIKGTGEFFTSFLGAAIIFIILFIILLIGVHYIGMKLIGPLNIPMSDLTNALNSNSSEVLQSFIMQLPFNEIIKIQKWSYLSLAVFSIFIYLTMFWTAEIVKESKNILKSLWISVKFIFRNFVNTFIFYILISAVQFIIMLICGLLMANSILAFISMLVYFYFIVYIVVLIFLFYERFEIETKNNCNSGSDSIGQN